MDTEVRGPNGPPHILQIVAKARYNLEDWIVYTGCVLVFSSLPRVAEVA